MGTTNSDAKKGKHKMGIFGLGDQPAKKKDTKVAAKEDSNQDNDAAAVLKELKEKEENSDTCAFC